MNCSKCNRDASNTKSAVKCVECSAVYHVSCCRIRTVAKLTAMSVQALAAWRCDTCSSETDSVASGKSDNDEPRVLDILQAIQKDIATNQASTNQGFKAVNDQLFKMQESLNQFKEKLIQIENENVILKEECGNLRIDNSNLNKKVNHQESEIEDLKQYSRNRNIEIKGIPQSKNEDVYYILECVAKALGITYDRSDISIAHRLPAPRNKSVPPSIVAQFVSRTNRAVWLKAARQRKIQTTDLVASLRPSPVLLVDHLTPQNKQLLWHAKLLVKNGQLAYAWVKEGKIMVRKTADGPVKRIRSGEEADDVAGVSGGEGREVNNHGTRDTSTSATTTS